MSNESKPAAKPDQAKTQGTDSPKDAVPAVGFPQRASVMPGEGPTSAAAQPERTRPVSVRRPRWRGRAQIASVR